MKTASDIDIEEVVGKFAGNLVLIISSPSGFLLTTAIDQIIQTKFFGKYWEKEFEIFLSQ